MTHGEIKISSEKANYILGYIMGLKSAAEIIDDSSSKCLMEGLKKLEKHYREMIGVEDETKTE